MDKCIQCHGRDALPEQTRCYECGGYQTVVTAGGSVRMTKADRDEAMAAIAKSHYTEQRDKMLALYAGVTPATKPAPFRARLEAHEGDDAGRGLCNIENRDKWPCYRPRGHSGAHKARSGNTMAEWGWEVPHEDPNYALEPFIRLPAGYAAMPPAGFYGLGAAYLLAEPTESIHPMRSLLRAVQGYEVQVSHDGKTWLSLGTGAHDVSKYAWTRVANQAAVNSAAKSDSNWAARKAREIAGDNYSEATDIIAMIEQAIRETIEKCADEAEGFDLFEGHMDIARTIRKLGE